MGQKGKGKKGSCADVMLVGRYKVQANQPSQGQGRADSSWLLQQPGCVSRVPPKKLALHGLQLGGSCLALTKPWVLFPALHKTGCGDADLKSQPE